MDIGNHICILSQIYLLDVDTVACACVTIILLYRTCMFSRNLHNALL